MSSVVIAGDTSGSVTLQAPATAGSVVVTLPATSGTMVVGGTNPTLSNLTVTGNAYLGTSGGNVGIGIGSAPNPLTVYGTADTTFTNNPFNVNFTSTNSYGANIGAGILFNAKYTSGGSYAGLAAISGVKENATDGDYAGALTFMTRANGSGGGNQERMRIDSNGNLLVGTSLSAGGFSELVINGNNNQSHGYNAGIQLNYGTGAFGGGAITTQNAAGGGLNFYTYTGNIGSESYTERMRIASTGLLMVGSTTPANAGWTSVGYVQCQGYAAKAGNAGAFSGNAFNFNWTGSLFAWVDGTNLGQVAFTSDYRIKRNIKIQTESGLDKVLKLRPVTYQMADYKEIFKAGEEVKEGFIAHEVQAVIPSGVDGEKDAENQIQSLRLDAILSVAVKAIQELNAKVTALEAQLGAK